MAERYLHVGFTFPGDPKLEIFKSVFDANATDWIRYSQNCWIAKTSKTAGEFYSVLAPHLTKLEMVLVVEVALGNRQGWQPQWVWDWFNKQPILR